MNERDAAIEIFAWVEAELPPDLDALLAEADATGHDWSTGFLPAWRERPFTEAGEALFLAREDDALLAMAVISADPFVADDATGRLRYIYVREAARRRGLAERLVRHCLARADGRWTRLRLHTDNPLAARLYARYGFRPAPNEPRATHVLDMTMS